MTDSEQREFRFELPLPVRYQEEIVTGFESADVDGSVLQLLGKTVKGSRRFSQVARTACLVTDAIGGHDIRRPYTTAGAGMKFPDLVLQLPMVDLTYLQIAAHIRNFGATIEKVSARCSDSECPQFTTSIDLNNLVVDFRTEPIEEIVVPLTRGFTKEAGESEFMGVKFTTLYMRPPMLQDMIRHENLYRDGDDFGEFQQKVLVDSITKLTADDGKEFPRGEVFKMGTQLIKSLKVIDLQAITKQLTELQMVSFELEVECPNCGNQFKLGYSPGFPTPGATD